MRPNSVVFGTIVGLFVVVGMGCGGDAGGESSSAPVPTAPDTGGFGSDTQVYVPDTPAPTPDVGSVEPDAGKPVVDTGAPDTSTPTPPEPDAGTTPPPTTPPVATPSPNGKAVTSPPPTFKRVTLLDDKPGAAWLKGTDLDGDGFDELLLTSLTEGVDWDAGFPPIAAGGAYILKRDGGAPTVAGDVGTWSSITGFDKSAGVAFPNHSSLFDINNDGVKDWVIGAGFLAKPEGNIAWMQGSLSTDGVLSFGAVQLIPIPDESRWYHRIVPADMDGDGDMDLVTTNHNSSIDGPGTSQLEWFENEGVAGQAVYTHHPIGPGGGHDLVLHDVDADGDMDIVTPQFFGGDSLVWFENPGAGGVAWKEYRINNTSGRGFVAEVVDLDGNGKLDIVYGNHNHQLATDPLVQVMGVYFVEIPDASVVKTLPNWDAYWKVIHEGFYVDEENPDQNGAPGPVHVGDVDGDGDLDVSVGGDGDAGMYVFVQNEGNTFAKVAVDAGHTMPADHVMMDLDADGDMDFVWAVYGQQGFGAPESTIYALLQENPSTTSPPLDPPEQPVTTPATDPSQPGALSVDTVQEDVPVGSTSMALDVYLPQGDGPYPVVVLLPGFQLASTLYASYGQHLASWGYVVLIPTMPGDAFNPIPHIVLRDYTLDLLDWVATSPSVLAGKADPGNVALTGHSLGGKVAVLASIQSLAVQAVFGLDPIDGPPPFQPTTADYPSVTPELMGLVPVPFGTVGETTNAADGTFGISCAPAAENFQQYYSAATGPALSVEVLGANHMSFLDNPNCGLACLSCPTGTDDPKVTQAIARRTLTAFLKRFLEGVNEYNGFLSGPEIDTDVTNGLIVYDTKNGF